MSEDINALSLSDEEFEKLPVPPEEEVAPEEPTEPLESSEEIEEGDSTTDEPETIEEPSDGLQDEEETDAETSPEVNEEELEVEDVIDYETVYKEIFKPFKANGKEMAVDSIEDVRQLMQMGANYNKKMAGLKPNLKLLKMLENNGLLSEDKLSYLIDLDKRNPDAIKKLIKESGVDPLDIDINSEVSYKPSTYNVNDKELELDSVLSEIKETESFNATVDIIGNKWDEASKMVLLDNPNIIKIINSHVSNGVYETITNEVERLRVLGKLNGLSDIDAYKAVGDALYAPRANAPQQMGNNINTTTSKATNKDDPRLKDRKKAASTTKSVASNVKPDFNPLAMSDDEFEKIASSKFI
jgi:hypothetical protein